MTRASRARRLRGLYAVTPEQPDTRKLVDDTERCLEGAHLVQYRAKALPPALALDQACALAQLCRAHGALFIVNDSIELAVASQADGVHLGRDDASPALARERFPEGLIGLSCYAESARARAAPHLDIDYIGVGSVFASGTKPQAQRAPLAFIAQARDESRLPVAAIGGIDLDNAPQVVAAGADMLAVITALFNAPDIAATARAFARLYAMGESDVRA
jgi:thiamine-phosphate pyrophosphorylase